MLTSLCDDIKNTPMNETLACLATQPKVDCPLLLVGRRGTGKHTDLRLFMNQLYGLDIYAFAKQIPLQVSPTVTCHAIISPFHVELMPSEASFHVLTILKMLDDNFEHLASAPAFGNPNKVTSRLVIVHEFQDFPPGDQESLKGMIENTQVEFKTSWRFVFVCELSDVSMIDAISSRHTRIRYETMSFENIIQRHKWAQDYVLSSEQNKNQLQTWYKRYHGNLAILQALCENPSYVYSDHSITLLIDVIIKLRKSNERMYDDILTCRAIIYHLLNVEQVHPGEIIEQLMRQVTMSRNQIQDGADVCAQCAQKGANYPRLVEAFVYPLLNK